MAQTLGGQFDLHARLIWEHAIDAIDDLRERTQSVFETQYELLPFRPIDFFERLNGTFDTYNVSKPSHLSNAKSSVPGKVSAARATIRDLKSNSSLQGKNATGKKQLPAVLAFLWDYHPETAQEFYKYVADQMPDQYADTFRRFANASVHEIGAAPTTENDNDSAKKEYLEKDAKQNAKRFTGAWWIAGAVILLSLIGSGILLGPSILGDDQIEIPEDDAQVDNVSQVSGTWDEITEAQWAAAPNSYFKTIATYAES
ncbi:hypothetical protein [Henriciella algicola]|uniref:Uncharacterized protein n=1 Tax=Henriciella algicola TaxID=1608422 RepID=A0A399RL84_9PROT|nr:hypothetical protein [Henriciella algicola]RIJ31044.1 hypothetical protein D1222_01890 [Henriciella algicola]